MGSRAPHGGGLKRPNTIKFFTNAFEITPEEVYQAVSKELKTTQATKCIAQLDSGWYNITFANEKDSDVIAAHGITISGMLLQCERANIFNSVVAYVKAPYEMTDVVVQNALMEYGTVINVRRQFHTFDSEVENGVRSMLIRNIKKPIPSFIRIGSFNLPVRHKGQQKTCRLCQQPGHVARDCQSKGRCFVCGDSNHRADHHNTQTTRNTLTVEEGPAQDTDSEDNISADEDLATNNGQEEGKKKEKQVEDEEEEEEDDDDEDDPPGLSWSEQIQRHQQRLQWQKQRQKREQQLRQEQQKQKLPKHQQKRQPQHDSRLQEGKQHQVGPQQEKHDQEGEKQTTSRIQASEQQQTTALQEMPRNEATKVEPTRNRPAIQDRKENSGERVTGDKTPGKQAGVNKRQPGETRHKGGNEKERQPTKTADTESDRNTHGKKEQRPPRKEENNETRKGGQPKPNNEMQGFWDEHVISERRKRKLDNLPDREEIEESINEQDDEFGTDMETDKGGDEAELVPYYRRGVQRFRKKRGTGQFSQLTRDSQSSPAAKSPRGRGRGRISGNGL